MSTFALFHKTEDVYASYCFSYLLQDPFDGKLLLKEYIP